MERAEAIPAFARQTGQTCSTCHTAYLQLTPFGRRFKLNGYISRGGALRNQRFGKCADTGDRRIALSARLHVAIDLHAP